MSTIAVEETSIRARVDLSQALHAELEGYARYWSNATGRKPRSLNDLIAAVLTEYLASDASFQKWQCDYRADGGGNSPFSQRPDSTPK
jgi:hypothetical protein